MAKKVVVIETLEEVDAKLLELGGLKVSISKAEANMNSKMQTLRAKFDEETQDDRAKAELIEKEIEQYCIVNRAKFEKTRTLDLTHGSIGFRTNPPKVGMLNRKYNVDTAIQLIKQVFKGLYVRQKEEVDKDAILAAYATKQIDDQQLAGVGLKIDQGEKFVCEPKWEELEQA